MDFSSLFKNPFRCCFRKKNKISNHVVEERLSGKVNFVGGDMYSNFDKIKLPKASACSFEGLDYLKIVTADSAKKCSISNCPNITTIKGKLLEELRITGKCNIEKIKAPNLKTIMIVGMDCEELDLFKKRINASLPEGHKVEIEYDFDTVVGHNKVQPQADYLSRFSQGAGGESSYVRPKDAILNSKDEVSTAFSSSGAEDKSSDARADYIVRKGCKIAYSNGVSLL